MALESADEALRTTLYGVLLTFSSHDLQIEYQLSIGFRVVSESYCLWFDDVYHPESGQWAAILPPAERRSFEQFSERLRRCEDVIGGKGLGTCSTSHVG